MTSFPAPVGSHRPWHGPLGSRSRDGNSRRGTPRRWRGVVCMGSQPAPFNVPDISTPALRWFQAEQEVYLNDSLGRETLLSAPSLELDGWATQAVSSDASKETGETEANVSSFGPWNRSSLQTPVPVLPMLAEGTSTPNLQKFQLPPRGAVILDSGNVLTTAKEEKLTADIVELEKSTGWRLRVLTRFAPGAFDTDEVRAYWEPDERTVIVICDLTSPNLLNFNTGDRVRTLLPRQFFIELQSRFGNQFYVAEQGDQEALAETVNTLLTCLSSPDGCQRVPGLSEDLFFLTVGTSIAGGAVFGFALRQEPTGPVTETWQWALLFSPLWYILFIALGLQPIASRTQDLAPLLKDTAAFLGAAAAVYLTPILGETPASRWFKKPEAEE